MLNFVVFKLPGVVLNTELLELHVITEDGISLHLHKLVYIHISVN